ncbi:MAG: hypothetical protein MUF34_22940 [Polyangiaceae bacterium]|jgi:uncharacterized membrane protein YkoI|nr:hypothetical protein [Polyangiaceae bacterium]
MLKGMRLWPVLASALLAACDPLLHPAASPTAGEPGPLSEAERAHALACVRGVVSQADVVRVAPARYRGRSSVVVALSSPNDELVDAYYGDGPGCDLVALVGGPHAAEVRPGAPFRSLSEARVVALIERDGFITSWALERDDEGDGRWEYRFDVDAGGHLQAVFVDALSARPSRAEPRPGAGEGPPAQLPNKQGEPVRTLPTPSGPNAPAVQVAKPWPGGRVLLDERL